MTKKEIEKGAGLLLAAVSGCEQMVELLRAAVHYCYECCFSKRMRKFFRKNEKSMLQFCNKNSKRKGRLQWVKKPL